MNRTLRAGLAGLALISLAACGATSTSSTGTSSSGGSTSSDTPEVAAMKEFVALSKKEETANFAASYPGKGDVEKLAQNGERRMIWQGRPGGRSHAEYFDGTKAWECPEPKPCEPAPDYSEIAKPLHESHSKMALAHSSLAVVEGYVDPPSAESPRVIFTDETIAGQPVRCMEVPEKLGNVDKQKQCRTAAEGVLVFYEGLIQDPYKASEYVSPAPADAFAAVEGRTPPQ